MERFKKILSLRVNLHIKRKTYMGFLHDAKKYIKHTSKQNIMHFSKQRLIGRIIMGYHIIEKGLTMPETKSEFGQKVLLDLIEKCKYYFKHYGTDNDQVNHAVMVLNEYMDFHKRRGYEIDINIIKDVQKLTAILPDKEYKGQLYLTSEKYFENNKNPFLLFAPSRRSLRNFTDKDIPINKVLNAIDLAQTSPSSCNRQPVRIRIINNKDILQKVLQLHTGSRGFGHLANKLIVLSAELGVYNEPRERNLAYIDSGIYAMNLLYALHYYEIGACILNWAVNPDTDYSLRELLKIPDSEIISLLIAIGEAPKEFKITNSPRYRAEEITLIY